MCLPQVIKSFQNYRVATTFYPTLVGGKDVINYRLYNFIDVMNGKREYIYIYIYMSKLMSLIVVILFNISLHVLGVPCPSSGDTILPGQPLW
jgi:hypothetical protein